MTAPTPAIPTFTTGDLLTQTTLNAMTTNIGFLYSFLMGGFRTRKPICAVRVTTVQTIATGTTPGKIIDFDIDDIDTDNMWVATGRNTITINTAGIYRLYGQFGHIGPAANELDVAILVNGTNFNTDCVGRFNGSADVGNCAATVPLAAGAAVHLGVYQNTGSTQTISTGNGGTRLSAEWISP